MSTTTSWLANVGQVIGGVAKKVLAFLGKEAKPMADIASAVASGMFPQFAPEIAVADNLITNIAKEAVAVEGAAAAAGTATGTGAQKLEAVLKNIGPAIDNWVASAFPGAKQVSTAAKSGLVNAVVGIMNEMGGGTVSATTPPAA
jgi:phage-related tail protein